MSKRNYQKKSDYWQKFSKSLPQQAVLSQGSYEPELLGEPFYVSDASVQMEVSEAAYTRTSSEAQTGARRNVAAFNRTIDRFSSIRNGLLPYSYAIDGVNVREAIELCQKAYANVAIFRNAIDIMSEFANTEVYLEGGSQKSRDFFYEWFKKIRIWNLKDQYFREYYRSGNVFMYRIDAEFNNTDFSKIVKSVSDRGAKTNKVPVKYILLNPFDIVAKRSTTFAIGAYEKILSQYELSRLQNPITDEDKEILLGLPLDVREKIKGGTYFTNGLKIELDPKKLVYSFYKKQDYEPFAVPFGYPVLEDINAKLELKKMDQAITRTVENVILLITMGTDPDKGGVNAHNLTAMQSLFKNESVGRVLVADYTTKADFIIPDLNKVLGPEKYKVLNEDIKQGLQNIVVGEEKYNTTEVKAQLFIDRLKESRSAFLEDFLQIEIKRIAKNLGMKSYPTAKFKDIDIRDQANLMRVSTRLMELGVITPQQGMEMFQTGQFPKPEDIAPAQDKFVKEREEGYYNPLVGGIPMIEPAMGDSEPVPRTSTPKTAGRPEGTTGVSVSKARYSMRSISEVVKRIETTRASISDQLKKKHKIKKFNEQQTEMLNKLCEAVITSNELENWEQCAASCVNNLDEISSLTTISDILDICSEHQLDDDYSAAILYHSQKLNENQ
jgi:hypothetical protein